MAHWSMAAAWAGYKQEHFFALEGDDQSYIVALYDLNNQVEGVVANERNRKGRRG